MKECPFCSKPTNDKPDNMYKIYISVGGGAYFCHRCGVNGSWYDFKSSLSGFTVDGTNHAVSNSVNVCVGDNGPPILGTRGGGVSQPWNWNTSNNQGMSYISKKQLQQQNYTVKQQQKIEPLPMPPKKLNSIYTTKLLNPTNSTSTSSKEYQVLQYLLQKRGLTKNVLTKYGVGCASYNFPDKNAKSGISYVASMCVTFPWLMRAAEVCEQEELRGATYVWKKEDENEVKNGTKQDDDGGRGGRKDKESSRGSILLGDKKKPSEMSALERYHYRREKKDRAKAAKLEEAAKRKKNLQDMAASSDSGKVVNEEELRALHTRQVEEEQAMSEEDAEALYGPYISRRIKVRSIEQKSWQRLDPPGGGFGLFGWHTVPHTATELIITEGEFDAMAVYQATGRPAVSLPNGCRSLPMEVLVLLERFDTIYLWMDNDGPGREGAEMFARKLGVERCLVVQPSGKRGWIGSAAHGSVVGEEEENGEEAEAAAVTQLDTTNRPTTPPKDANEALLTGWDLNELLEEARELPHERILKFSDLRDQVSFFCVFHLKIVHA